MRPDGEKGGGFPGPAAPRPRRPAPRGPIDLGRTRARELARLLPVLGAVLFFLPLLGTNIRATGATGIWLFLCWAALILVAALLAPGLKRDLDPDGDARRGGR